jgi:hypothetical protein
MPNVATEPPAGGLAPFLPVTVEPGEKLYREFLAGRSRHTLQAYGQDLAAFAAFQGNGRRARSSRWAKGRRECLSAP